MSDAGERPANDPASFMRPVPRSPLAGRDHRINAAGIKQEPVDRQFTAPVALALVDFEQIAGSGIYRVSLRRDGQFVPIARLIGTDDEGILYLGMSTDLRQRVKDIVDSFLGGKMTHGTGQRYHRYRLHRRFEIESIHVQWCNLELPSLLMRQFEQERDEWEVYSELDRDRQKLIDSLEHASGDEFDRAAAFLWERSGLAGYASKFGELPPLNRVGGSHSGDPLPPETPLT